MRLVAGMARLEYEPIYGLVTTILDHEKAPAKEPGRAVSRALGGRNSDVTSLAVLRWVGITTTPASRARAPGLTIPQNAKMPMAEAIAIGSAVRIRAPYLVLSGFATPIYGGQIPDNTVNTGLSQHPHCPSGK